MEIKAARTKRAYKLSASVEMLWPDETVEWRIARLTERGFGVALWNWPNYDVNRLAAMKADYTIMNGYIEGRLADPEGADALLQSAKQGCEIARQLDLDKLNLHGTGLSFSGEPLVKHDTVTAEMWSIADSTLKRICELADEMNVMFTLENLNCREHQGCPFNTSDDVLRLVSTIDHPRLRINLDLYHAQNGEGDLVRKTKACLPWLAEVQIADNPGRNEPGVGEINYTAIANLLETSLYSGAVCMEAYPATSSDVALDAFERIF